ncbi:MAG: hypothetical protein LBI36_00770 [Oscillospiraceae bacterium]|jgi:hypothetical protein|nr:hypothetical protein [Oscillospiraceae bacterium]
MSDENPKPKIKIDDSRFDSFDFERLRTQTTLREAEEGKKPVFLNEALEDIPVLTDEASELKAVFEKGFIHAGKIRELYHGNLYDKAISVALTLILLLLLNPAAIAYSAFAGNLAILSFVFALAAYIIISVLVCDWGFWIPPLVLLAAAKLIFVPAGDVVISFFLSLFVVLASLFKRDRLAKEQKGELGFTPVTDADFRQAGKRGDSTSPASRFNDGEFEHLMVVPRDLTGEPLSVSTDKKEDIPAINPAVAASYSYEDLFIPEDAAENSSVPFDDGFDDE